MATVISPPEEKILLHDVTWETYGQLLANYENSSGPRFTYDRGVLEIMSPSSEHEELNDLFKLLVYIAAAEEAVSDTPNPGSRRNRAGHVSPYRPFRGGPCPPVQVSPKLEPAGMARL